MSATWAVIAAVLVLVGVLLVAANHLGRRFELIPEVRRKIVHFGSGFLGLSFPWLFDTFWPVAVICSLSLTALIVIRWYAPLRRGLGDSIHGVDRHTLGDFVVPLAIATLYLLADGDRMLYGVPMLLLTLADGSAALVAIRYGLSPYPTLDGKKTFEGTAVFFAVASWATLVPLMLFSDIDRADVLLVTLIVASIGSLIEAASWSGLDNVFIPWGSFFALRRCLSMTTSELVVELVVLVTLAAIVFVVARRSQLTVQARFCALLGTFVVWAVVGWRWVAPAVTVVVLHPLMVPVPRKGPLAVDLRAVMSVATCAVWVFLQELGVAELDRSLYAFTVGLAAHLMMISDARRRTAPAPQARADHVRWSVVATAAAVGWYGVRAGLTRQSLLFVALALPIVLVTSYLFALIPVPRLTTRAWSLQAWFGLQASAVAYVVHTLLHHHT